MANHLQSDGPGAADPPEPQRFGGVTDNYFELLGVAQTLDLDAAELEQRWKTRVAQVHPDRFASSSAAEKRVAMQWSAQINEAYRTLRDPLSRARYLCAMHGHPVNEASGGQLDMEFLEQQMQWREDLQSLRETPKGEGNDGTQLQVIAEEVELVRQQCMDQTQRMIEAQCWPQAVAIVQQWLFVDKFTKEIARARNAIV